MPVISSDYGFFFFQTADTMKKDNSLKQRQQQWVRYQYPLKQNEQPNGFWEWVIRHKVDDQGKRILCTLDETGESMAIESRKVDCRRLSMADTEITDCDRWVCFGPQR